MTFSIIMPVYNTGRLLRTAVESIVRQSNPNWELLLIDDGSTDGSGRVCDEWSAKDRRIKTFHTANGGICHARNYGLKRCLGDYVLFCDHDDEYYRNYLEVIDREANLCSTPDIIKIQFELADRFEDGRVVCTFHGWKGGAGKWAWCEDGYDVFTRLTLAVWDGAYRTAFLQKNNVCFDESFRFGAEDFHFMIGVLSVAKDVRWCEDVCYCHYVNFGKSTSSKYHSERIDDLVRVAKFERERFPCNSWNVALARYRRWNSTLYFSAFLLEGAPLSVLKKTCLFMKFKQGVLQRLPMKFSKGACVSVSEIIYTWILLLRIFWLYSLIISFRLTLSQLLLRRKLRVAW